MMVERFLQLDIQKIHNLSGEIQNCTLKCFHGSFLMVWVVLVMKDRDINCQMQSTNDTSCCIMINASKKDPYFPLIAFYHEQIKDSTTSGFILAKQKSFDNIANRLLQINSEVLADITERMMKGERVKGESQDEKDCLQLIHDLDRIGGHVKGSITSKKYMRNEIWSLISFRGAPSWYITLSPADNKHPISLYYADTEEFTPIIRSKSEKDSLIADNPVASARFFHFMIQAFIKHVLGV